MKNIIIFVLIATLAITGYLFGYPAYQLKQTENSVRNTLKNININHIINANKDNSDFTDDFINFFKDNLIRIESKNLYPSLQLNIILNDTELLNKIKPLHEVLPFIVKNTKELQKEYLCQKMIDAFKNEPNTTKQALINVLHKDNVQFEITLVKADGLVINQYSQKATDCLGLWATSSI
ncbi:hypothetical protein LP123_08455 [Moraxella bovis]|uniref:Uncharacterized protein n=1 Tax=Moraxella bovis TaxID=476 RepID=A0AAQ2QAF6_MORBO|nr:hypothetical protein [Moraxella bovis]AWY20524.1 hypothetical protein DQF64_08480 [Moraxella bovis]UYZ76799.1 hypothetical protein LP093_05820 [Moraxella bovis]UYZ77246.1 hypothetical protein LP115_07995 [Moraxella bovis]UYZ82271.1 hypothetical protein LP113_06135 [Moraxella bovis]UYZ85733.1 hypothetical protein LP094_08040 [Moraxella bovis]